jgi:hypothetical protein
MHAMEGILTLEMPENPTATLADFSQLNIPVRTLEGSKLCRYRVYVNRSEYKLVEAETAGDALKVSGVVEPTRIYREVPGRQVMIDRNRLLE